MPSVFLYHLNLEVVAKVLESGKILLLVEMVYLNISIYIYTLKNEEDQTYRRFPQVFCPKHQA